MQYSCAVEINKPIDEVIKQFDNNENMKIWMNGLQSFETIKGAQGEVGAVSKLIFLNGKRKTEMIETITEKNLPNSFAGKYEAKGIVNFVHNKFEVINEQTTLYSTENVFQMKGMMKIMGWLMPGAFMKQSIKYLNNFKTFVESK